MGRKRERAWNFRKEEHIYNSNFLNYRLVGMGGIKLDFGSLKNPKEKL